MATIYNVKIKTVSAFCAYDKRYVEQILKDFLEKFRDDKTGLGFEGTEIEVEVS